MMNVNASQMIRNLLVCGCVLSAGFLASSAMADGRGDGDRRTIAADRDQPAARDRSVDRSSDSPRRGSVSGRSSRSSDTPPAAGRGGYFFKGGSPLSEGQDKPIPKSMWSRASGGNPRMTSPGELPWRESPRSQDSGERVRTAPRSSPAVPQISDQRSRVTPRSSEVNQQVARSGADSSLRRAPEIRTDSSRVPFSAMAQADQTDRQPRRAARSEAPRVADTPRVVDSPAPSNRPTIRAREDAGRPSSPPPAQAPVTTDRPRTIQRDDTPRRGPVITNTPDRSQPVIRNDNSNSNSNRNNDNNATQTPANRTNRSAPVVRGDSQGPKASADVDRPVARSREDTARSIARPTSIPDNSRNQGSQGNFGRGTPNTAGSLDRGLPISRPGADVARTRTNTGGSTPVVRSNDDVARSIARPSMSNDRVARPSSDFAGRTNTNISRSAPITRSRTDSAQGSVTGDRSLPISRTRDDVARSTSRSPIGTDRAMTRETARTVPDIARTPRGLDRPGMGRSTSTPDASRMARDTNTRTFDRTTRGVGRDNVPLARSTAREDSLRSASAVRRDGTIRTASFHDSRTVARGTIAGRDFTVRTAHNVHGHDVYVINAGHFRPNHWPHGDYRPYHGGWHHGDWHHGHHVDIDVSFTFVHSYCAPAGVFYYDVVPVAPVVYTAPVYSLSFAYVGHHHGVVVSSVRYVEPVFYAPPTMVVYPTVYAAPVVAPVVFTPIVAAPVIAPVAVPVVTPVYAPMYYYYPAYAYYPVYTAVVAPTYVVEPAPVPVVAAPAVVEAPSSGWSINTAFSFLGHHGKSFGFGASFTKVKSAPAVVAAPAAVTPAVAVEPAPAEAAPAGEMAQVAPASNAPAAEVTLEAGLAAIRGGNMEQSRNILSQVVISDPDNGMARMLYSAALMADGQYKEAAESLRRSFETWPDFQLKDFYLPAVYDNPKVFTQTMRDVREFLSDHPERTDAWLLVAWSYAVSGQSSEATMLLTEAQKSWPEDSIFASLDKAVQANDAAEQASASAK